MNYQRLSTGSAQVVGRIASASYLAVAVALLTLAARVPAFGQETKDARTWAFEHKPDLFEAKVSRLEKLGRPVWCTEYLARGAGSTFDGSLPVGKRHHVAMINWGLVDGKTQTRLPWDSWTIPYVNGREPVVWHHEIFHADGTPYRQAEVELIRALTGTR